MVVDGGANLTRGGIQGSGRDQQLLGCRTVESVDPYVPKRLIAIWGNENLGSPRDLSLRVPHAARLDRLPAVGIREEREGQLKPRGQPGVALRRVDRYGEDLDSRLPERLV